ncbi:hypothetical protein FAZ95_17755 [Trinickia violacea]|uniref:DUF4880 domain-containing protein n=1 Tax=Trinickia violacea TaxID=2571746 RepID=A0A4P8IUQ5_9BURK|nr:hypothetical protein [Trinickia violacea]QCP50834.1 hypothetical protein FAZ95_17755 [Trinickia violacea]
MTPERFQAIVEAYGADSRRWPAAERASAQAWAERHRQEADALMADSAWLDACLASDPAPQPSDALVARVVALAPASAGRRSAAKKSRRWVWWSGAAFAGVGLAGGLAGALAVSFFVVTGSVPPPEHESPFLSTSFGGSAADWSGE